MTYHLNLGAGVTRMETRPFWTWGLITELPVIPAFRVVSEVNGESVEQERANNSVLVGFIWQPFESRKLWIDAGVRHGTTSAAPEWQVTVGLTFGFSLARERR